MLEALQVLKFDIKHDGLDFIDGLLAKPEDYSIAGPLTEPAFDELA